MAYIYQADVWCDACGEKIREELTAEGKAPSEPEDERTYDSDDFPKYYDAENEESDSPENCASGNCAGEYGTFLQNQLTQQGYRHLKSMLDRHGEILPAHAQEWAEYYQFSYFKNEYESAHDWLDKTLQYHANQIGEITYSSNLLSIARDLASKLDGDQIQDLFQSDMDSDGFFKKTGWYSVEADNV